MAKSLGKVAVAGAGLMGTGIAHGLANAGYDVALVDINAQALDKARTNIDEILAGGVKLGKLTGEHHEQTMARLKTFTSVAEAAKDAELFVETVAENLAIKLAVVKEAETTLAPGLTSIDAEAAVGFSFLKERFATRVVRNAAAAQIDVSLLYGPFKRLKNQWRFRPHPEGTEVAFDIDFEFKSRILDGLLAANMDRAVDKLVSCFEARAQTLYGAATATV